MHSTPRAFMVLEQTLGHVTHGRNMQKWSKSHTDIAFTWIEVPFDANDRYARLPLVKNNWTLRASLRAERQVRLQVRTVRPDVLFYHTQVTALFGIHRMSQIPTVVSLDATPANVDSLAAAYDHHPSKISAIERFKTKLSTRVFQRAGHLVTWCHWAKESLVKDYEIAPGKVTVIPPGIDLSEWQSKASHTGSPIQLLFVGADFKRKGGEMLLSAAKQLPEGVVLNVVTRHPIPDVPPGVRVFNGLTANSPGLIKLYQEADIFVFPTHGDCLPIAVMEAMATGLPVIATRVGAIGEEVEEGSNGFLIETGDEASLTNRIVALSNNLELRQRMSDRSLELARERFSGETNYGRLMDVIKSLMLSGEVR